MAFYFLSVYYYYSRNRLGFSFDFFVCCMNSKFIQQTNGIVNSYNRQKSHKKSLVLKNANATKA